MWIIRVLSLVVVWGSIKATRYPTMVSAAASDTTMEPYEHFLTTSLCYVEDQVRTHPEHSGVWPKDPNAISLFDVLGLDPYQKPFRPVRESIYPEGKNGKEAKEALENKAVDWKEAKKILGNGDMPDHEVIEFLKTGVNQTALIQMPGPDIDRLMDMTMRYMAHTVLSDQDRRLVYQVKFLPRLKSGELQKFCDDIMEKHYSHDEL